MLCTIRLENAKVTGNSRLRRFLFLETKDSLVKIQRSSATQRMTFELQSSIAIGTNSNTDNHVVVFKGDENTQVRARGEVSE